MLVAIADCFPDIWIEDVAAWVADKGYDDADDAAQAAEEATWLLWMLTGQRFTSKYQARRDLYRSRSGVAKFRLALGPVDRVYSLKRLDPADDSLTDITTWTDLRGGLIRLSSGSGFASDFRRNQFPGVCTLDDTLIQVEYLIKPNVPAGAERVTKKLAAEFYKSLQGSACALPDRITTVTRQNLSWTILDPQDFLQRGLTGMGPVDQWISGANLRGYAGITDPLQWLERVSSEVIGCGVDFDPDAP